MKFKDWIENLITSQTKDELMDVPLLDWGDRNHWTARHSFEGTIIFGATGSGKTSGAGQKILSSLLKAGYGGLVLCVKNDEWAHWQRMARKAGRENDLIRFSQNEGHCFNPLEFIQDGQNAVSLILTLSEMLSGSSSGKSENSFWREHLLMLLRNSVDLCFANNQAVDLKKMEAILQSFPRSPMDVENKRWQESSICWHELCQARLKLESGSTVNLDRCREYFLTEMPALTEKTRSIVVQMAIGVLDNLLREPLYSHFCKQSTISPLDAINDKKIIVVDMPTMGDGVTGRLAGLIWKFCFQRAVEKRTKGHPVFIAADEAQYFLTPEDSLFQTTARSTRCASIYLTQNLPNLRERLGEINSRSLLGNLKTRIFHQNACVETNRWASETIGEIPTYKKTTSFGQTQNDKIFPDQNTSHTESTSRVYEAAVRPEEFTKLKTGGPENDHIVEGYIHQSGKEFTNQKQHLRIKLRQK